MRTYAKHDKVVVLSTRSDLAQSEWTLGLTGSVCQPNNKAATPGSVGVLFTRNKDGKPGITVEYFLTSQIALVADAPVLQAWRRVEEQYAAGHELEVAMAHEGFRLIKDGICCDRCGRVMEESEICTNDRDETVCQKCSTKKD